MPKLVLLHAVWEPVRPGNSHDSRRSHLVCTASFKRLFWINATSEGIREINSWAGIGSRASNCESYITRHHAKRQNVSPYYLTIFQTSSASLQHVHAGHPQENVHSPSNISAFTLWLPSRWGMGGRTGLWPSKKYKNELSNFWSVWLGYEMGMKASQSKYGSGNGQCYV